LRSIDEILKESRPKIEEKRKRGRPKKEPAETQTVFEPKSEALQSAPEKRESCVEAIRPYVDLLGRGLADHFEVKELEFSRTESDIISTQVDQLLLRYMPTVSNSPHAVLYGAVFTIGGVAIGKYMVYREAMRVREKNERRDDSGKI